MGEFWKSVLFLSLLVLSSSAEHVRDLEVFEGAPVGTRIGFIGDGFSTESGPPYLIVPVGSALDTDLSIDQTTGEIKTKVLLDREVRNSYSLVAIPISGDNIRVQVKVLDENDNAPTFPIAVMNIEFPENTPRDVKRTLHPARDLDLDIYNTQRYNIVSGNVNDAFRLSSHRERDGVLYLDLQINGYLDRETTDSYDLVIEALDGGTPPLRGEMTVYIKIQDVNDNQPIFNQSRYFAIVPENATIGTNIIQIFATDKDAGENGNVGYFINRRQSDRDNMFRIDGITGQIAVNKPLDFEAKEMHELVVVAKDHGMQPLETTAFVSIKVTDVNDNQPTITVIFLSDDATPKISESAQPGEFVARISVNDPDSKADYSNINVTLTGGDGRFGLTTRDNIIYLVIVSLPLDREMQPNYTLNVVATDTGTPPLHASRTINLKVTDINDNAPEFLQEVYHANVMEVSDPGTSVTRVFASDKDEGNNSAITYSLVNDLDTHSSWFRIDSRSGLVTTKAHVDCETDPVPRLTVIATDNGFPPLSSSATVFVTIHDVNDNEPIFDQSFYNVSVAENGNQGRCILKVGVVDNFKVDFSSDPRRVSATDPDCGVNAMVNYTLGDGFGKQNEFEVRSSTGEICILSKLNFENRNIYEFPVKATDRGGLSTTAMVKIQVTDVNDNHPIFYPREYNVSLREGASSLVTVPLVVVVATDPDSGRYGSMTYRIVAGNEGGLFRIDRNSGEIFVSRPSLLSTRSQPFHHLNITATDGGGLKSEVDAEVFISIIDSAQKPPIFEQTRYIYSIRENVKRDTFVGSVKATVMDGGHHTIRYSIYSGDPDGYFRIDPSTGSIRTASNLDHEGHANVLLNIQTTSGNPPAYGHAQVNIEIEDVNDNPPEFESSTVRISVPENVEIGVPIYAAHARDRDSGINGVVHYRLSNNVLKAGLFAVDPKSGSLTIVRRLDYETTQRHSLIITAYDAGIPSLSANLTVLVEVQDINDNAPVFEQTEYNIKVLESMPVNSQILQVTAVDLDTGNNARLTYRMISPNSTIPTHTSEVFGIFPNSGWVYLHATLDREKREVHRFTVVAIDNGTPSQSATARVVVKVLDYNDNDPAFVKDSYEFKVDENVRRGTFVGTLLARDSDVGINAMVKYYLIPSNTSFQINSETGEISTKDSLDRELKDNYDLMAEARDQGSPQRSSRVSVKIKILDVNDNAPEIVDPQEDVVSVREEQQPNTEVVRVRAIDPDEGNNSSITYSILKSRDSDGYGIFSIDPISGIIRTKIELDHEEKTIYRLAVAATDNGYPTKQTIRMLRVEVLDLNDNRPTFTSSSLSFKVREDVQVGYIVGTVSTTDLEQINSIPHSSGEHVTYTLTSLTSDEISDSFEIDRSIGSLIVARELDREVQSEYRLEVRALDTSTINNPQSSAVTVRIDIIDVNDNAPKWAQDPVAILVSENTPVGSLIYNFTAKDVDAKLNGELRYKLVKNDSNAFRIDSLTGSLFLTTPLDFETLSEYTIVVKATDQCLNVTERLSTSITARVIVTDANDNTPKFVIPTSSNIFIKDSITVGEVVTRIVAVDVDSGDNGRITYVIVSGNEENRFSLGYDTGIVTLTKPISFIDSSKTFTLNVTASDHGTPTRHAHFVLKLSIQGSIENPPRFINFEYQAKVPEDSSIGTFVARVGAKFGFGEMRGNLTYVIPSGIADDAFSIDSVTGVVTTKKVLDYETCDRYRVPIYVTDSVETRDVVKTQFDVTLLSISIVDVNDHAPEFLMGSCSPLSIPENNELVAIHTIVAKDADSGPNGEITYAITSGNIGNKFSINMHTGELTAKPLDREANSRYRLTITAQDHGYRPLQGSCNITILVEDQNDNDPKFGQLRYSATILEDVPIDTSILKVHASDADIGVNSRIIYSLTNESQWLFRIDNKTGVITTTGQFDRERQSVYNFLVVASDSGKYDARSQKVPVSVQIGDINDNKPIFTKYPFKQKVSAYIQPGQPILKVTANDADHGTNSEIVYNLVNDGISNKFRINPNNGILSATQSLASENRKTIYLNVIATDKGNPPQSSIGLIEISVGDLPENSPQLIFQNSTYVVSLLENTEQFKDVLKVSAVRTDGRRQKIQYFFGSGNEANIFVINSESGVIQVRNSRYLDYELRKEIRLVVEARTDGSPRYHGFCDVAVKLIDQNDNAPTFSQQEYSATVWEGNSKGAFVLQVTAFDADEDKNSRVLYHIVDGNHDNAFMIEPAFSGIIKTNIVLDREIRDTYRLTVIATDDGVPQMTGTTRIRMNIVDVNDNQPTFPPHSIIAVSEDTEVGTILTTVTANDVDTNPALTYSLLPDNDTEIPKLFGIDLYSGKVILKMPLDFENRQEYHLKIAASDTAHIARTILTIKVTDVNDNPPVFSQSFYHAALPDGNFNSLLEILTVNATDADSDKNAQIRYSLNEPISGFSIGEQSGVVKVNLSEVSLQRDLQITLIATDYGTPPLHSSSSVYVKTSSSSGFEPQFTKYNYRAQIPENTLKGTVVLHLANSKHNLYITEGNTDGTFEVINPTGIVLLIKSLDREAQASFNLKLQAEDRLNMNGSVINVYVEVDDVNDNAPVFKQADFEISVSESTQIGTSIMQFQVLDNDLQNSDNSRIVYEITSGNDNHLFELDSNSGVLKINSTLDYDRGVTEHNLIIEACDCGTPALCSLNSFHILIEDDNDNPPRFPVLEYFGVIGENEPVGTAVFTAHATDLDKGPFGALNYSLESFSSTLYNSDDVWKFFRIDSLTGLVTTSVVFDYEQKSRYVFTLKASDTGGKMAAVKVRVEIDSRDEFHPQFTERTYRFTLATPQSGSLPVGYVVGHVSATDRDKGPDGRVVYQLSTQHQYFRVNRTTGAVQVKKKFTTLEVAGGGKDVGLVVTASSGRQGSLTNMTFVEITLDPLADIGTNLAINNDKNATMAAGNGGLGDWALGLLIAFILLLTSFGAVLVFLHMRNKRNKKGNKPNLSNDSVSSTNNYVDPSAFDTIPIRGGVGTGANNNQFAPPKYDEIPPYGASHATSSNSGAATTSELSGSEQSGSSGRGSAEDGEDGEDEEIRMINEGPLQRDSGIHRQNDDEDNLSDVSVRNTQEYLARLGIVNNNSTGVPQAAPRMCGDPRAGSSKDGMHLHQGVPLDSLHMFEEHNSAENDITNLIYAKLNDVAGSDRVSSTGENGAVATTNLSSAMDHVMAIGGYGEVSTVTHQPSMNGSLSSIVHSEEELAGSYNWDYLLDWGPQYQPLAHVFSEIARLKDDTASLQSVASGTSSVKSKSSVPAIKNVPPPLITSVAPRSIAMPVLNSRGGSSHHVVSNHNQVHLLPRSPISHDAGGGTFASSAAMSPSFSPSLSPLATKSPSISPLVTQGVPTSHHVVSRQTQNRTKTVVVDTELRI